MSNPDFILGSGSYTRKQILKDAGYSYIVHKADIDEKAIGNRTDSFNVDKLVIEIATAKADNILNTINYSDGILLTADQVVLFNMKILEKPESLEQAREYINSYGNSFCQTVGSIVLTDINTKKRVSGYDTAKIYFEPIPSDVIESLIKEGQVLNCAGGLMIEHPLVKPFINKIEGSEDSLMGLSIDLLNRLLISLKES
eukprot:gene19659-25574_t